MTCQLGIALASDHLDGKLTRQEEQLYLSHLASCHDCAHRREELLGLKSIFARLAEPVPSERILQRLERCIDDRPRSWMEDLQRWLGVLVPPPGLLSSAAGALALVVLTWAMLPVDEGRASDRGKRQAVLTVWDTTAERIETSFDPSGLTRCAITPRTPVCRPVAHRTTEPGSERVPPPTDTGVRMCLFEVIDVNG